MSELARRDTASAVARRLTLLYCAALGCIALLAVLGQVVVQELISRQYSDSAVVNVAGRQRMLSQRIAKTALALRQSMVPAERAARREELSRALALWNSSHRALLGEEDGLLGGVRNSPAITGMFAAIEPGRAGIAAACEALLADTAHEAAEIEKILALEADYLVRMDEIVHQYELEARARVERLRDVERLLLALTLTVLGLEGLFVFRPAVRQIRETMRRYGASEAERELVTAELATILDTVPALILFHDREGRILRANKPGAEIIGEPLERLHGSSVYQWFPDDAERLREEDRWIFARNAPRTGLLHFLRNSQGDVRWLRMNKVPYHDLAGNVTAAITFAVDVSAHKRLEKRLMELRAVEERKLGYDLHDGLGQHLSGILYLSRRLENLLRGRAAAEAENAGEIVNLVKEAIETVRGLSQGLRPLGDDPRALALALTDLARRTREITGIDCSFVEKGTVLIFESDVAEHLFRIAQEAINNAIRHSGCRHIQVLLRQGDDQTSLEITDDGTGLDAAAWRRGRRIAQDPDGLGLSIMEHRAELMGATFAIEAAGGGGTTVRCALKT